MPLSLLLLSLFLSSLFLYTHAPLARAALLLAQTLALSLAMFNSMKSPWFPFILLMIFLSGLMVIFAYVSSLASNDFAYLTIQALTMVASFILIFSVFSALSHYPPITGHPVSDLNEALSNCLTSDTYKVYSPEYAHLTTLLVFYLLLALLVVVKVSSFNPSPLRSTI